MPKVVINTCFGGFGLSPKGVEAYLARKGKQCYWFKDARDEGGRRSFDKKVPCENPASEFIAYSYTSPEPSRESHFYDRNVPRDDPDLVAVVESLGKEANGQCASLSVVEVPDGVDWEIDEYDGNEHVAERHRTWR